MDSSGPVPPARLTQAVALLELEPGMRVLEIGGGRGAAGTLISARLAPGGAYVGLDRSAAATAAARKRLRGVGNAALVTAELARADVAQLGVFDLVFASNVNVFWTSDAKEELEALATLLPRGRPLWLVYDTPGGAPPLDGELMGAVCENLSRAGYRARRLLPRVRSPLVAAVRAVRPPR